MCIFQVLRLIIIISYFQTKLNESVARDLPLTMNLVTKQIFILSSLKNPIFSENMKKLEKLGRSVLS